VIPAAPRIGLALAGGGPLGAVYEIGALCALDEALVGLDLTQLDGYVGVSAGSFVAAGLANGMRPRELCAAFIEDDPGGTDLFSPALLMQPDWPEYARRALALPGLALQAVWQALGARRSRLAAFERLGQALPPGLFSGAAMERRLAQLFAASGRSNDFRTLSRRLVLVATDLDSGDAVAFGQPGLDHVPISRAIQASAALPGLYAPVEIDGRTCVDGALKKTLHASVLLDDGLDLLLCLNPLVPFDATQLDDARGPIPRLAAGGLPLVLSQTFRSLIHSRLTLGLDGYARAYPDTDIVLIEPDHRDGELFGANLFSVSQRRALAEHAYQCTRRLLRARRSTLRTRLEQHGVVLDDAVLDDATRHLVVPPQRRATRTALALRRLDETLADLEHAAAAR
jgi:NTE family protein